jgi:hypothetical protein
MGSVGSCGRPSRLGARERRRLLVVGVARAEGARQLGQRRGGGWGCSGQGGAHKGRGWHKNPRVRLIQCRILGKHHTPKMGVTFHYIGRIWLSVQVIQYKTIYNTICLTFS